MSASPFLSIIMPAFNAERFLAEAVQSVFRSSVPLELILVDDGSTDGTEGLARGFGKSLTYIRQENAGPSSARNRGLQAARGEMIGFLDADDLWADSHPAAALSYLERHAEVDLVLGQIDYLIQREFNPELSRTPFHSYQVGAAILRRAVWERVGGFDPTMRYGEDVDWFLRIREAGASIAMRAEVSLHYRLHSGNQPNLFQRSRIGLLEACQHAIARRRDLAEAPPPSQSGRPLISVVIPAYNAGEFIAAAIESVLQQDYRPFELIVVNDGSTDRTAEIVKKFPQVVLLEQSRRGTGAALNEGVRVAKGEFLAFLDADDLWSAGKLTRQMQAFANESGIEAVFVHVAEFRNAQPAEDLRKIAGWTPGAMLITRAAFARIGPFADAASIPEGVEWYMRAVEKSLRSLMLPDVFHRRRLHSRNRGIVDRDWHGYIRVIKASLDRRRSRETDSHVERT